MPIDGGNPVRIWDRPTWSRIGPDGKSVLVGGEAATVSIIPAAGGAPIASFEGIYELGWDGRVQWSADGAALLYVKTTGGVSNIWQRPLDGKRLALARGANSNDVVLIRDLKQ
jgi:Tol biopolymer transport system component